MPDGSRPSALKDVPSVRLNYRYEADVPPPEPSQPPRSEQKNEAVQADFDQNRTTELLDLTIASPDGKRIAAVYHRTGDLQAEFRLDMYTGDGRLLKKVTSDLMAVHFPDTIRWSPDSSSLAFVAMLRGYSPEPENPADADPNAAPTPPAAIAETNVAGNAEESATPEEDNSGAVPTAEAPAAVTPEPPVGILTFRTEQLYLCNADGTDTKPVTQNEGFIYFYYVWAPDSSMLAAMAVHSREWRELERRADADGSVFVPMGRLRVVERSGRERRLDDALTKVQPVWSPDSAKVAAGFDTQIRIYDALGNNPTQAAIPLRNQLLLSAQAYDRSQAEKLNAESGQESANAAAPAQSTLPDPSTLVSFNPIVMLSWTSPDLLYFETAYIRRMKNEADSATSFVRWHRLVLTPQASTN
ncbi:MAG: hypothetical protein AB7V18_12935 [Pyrinomonadaceae bacterium]